MEIEWHENGSLTVTIHQSWMDGYGKCPERARRAIESPEPPSDATIIGTGMHAACAALLEGSGDPIEALLVAIGEEAAHPMLNWTKFSTVSELETIAKGCFYAWEAGVLPALKGDPVDVEHKFNVPIGTRTIAGTPVNLRLAGTWDYEDDKGLWDWKTASSLRAYGPQALRKAVQPTAYTLGKVLEEGLSPELILDFNYGVVVKKKVPEPKTFATVRHQGDWAWLIDQMWQAVMMYVTMPEGPWPLLDQEWVCSERWCSHYYDCRGKPRILEIQ